MKRTSKILLLSLVYMALAIAMLIVWAVWENTALVVTEVTVASNRLPAGFSGCRIAQVSDLHNAEFGEGNGKLLARLSESKPDCIMLTGDLVDAHHTNLDVALHFAEEAVKIAPTYYVSGNHEAWLGSFAELQAGLVEAGVTVLEDGAVTLEKNGEKIRLIGLSDPDFTVKGALSGETPAVIRAKLQELTEGEGGFTLLLSHRPELFDIYASCGVDLVLAGHAHGGQFRLPFLGGLYAPGQGFFPKYDAGLYTKGATAMVVSRGLGNSVMPLRINNRPEIVLIDLRA